MDFSAALTIIKDGGLVRRKHWGHHYIKLSVDGAVYFHHESHELSLFFCGPSDLLGEDWHMVKPEDVGLDHQVSGKILQGDEVHAVPVSDKVVPIKG